MNEKIASACTLQYPSRNFFPRMSLIPWLSKINTGEIRLVLGSSSVSRKAVIGQLQVPFEVVVSTFAEDLDKSLFASVEEYPRATAMEKDKDIAARIIGAGVDRATIVVTGDTVVVRDGAIIEKPENTKESAVQMLWSHSGRVHHVVTGVVVRLILPTGVEHVTTFICKSEVKFATLTQTQIDAYVATGEPFNRSGGYSIMGLGQILVQELRGSYTNIAGIPLHETTEAIAHLLEKHLGD